MSLVRSIVATVVATSTLLIGVVETALGDSVVSGVSRVQPLALDATGCVESPAEAEAEDDDARDHVRGHVLLACGPLTALDLPSVTRFDLPLTAGSRAGRPHRATDLIRGPPARG